MLAGRGRSVRYGGLSATDARGRALRSWLGAEGGAVRIHVDDRHAAYPIRVDPLVQAAKLTLADGVAGDTFAAVALSGDTLAVGAPGRKVGANDAQGEVFVFQRPAAGWAQATPIARLTASDGVASDGLGSTVAISGDTIVAGASSHKVGTHAFQGAAYVFVKPAGAWRDATQTAELTASDGETSDGFPAALDISGDTVVGGPGQHTVNGHFRQGEAYAFVKAAGGWADANETAKLLAQDGAEGDGLGRAVAVSGDTIVVGAPTHKVGNNADQGAAYVFAKPTAGTSAEGQSAVLTASDGAASDQLGTAVDIAGDTAVAGAPNHQVGLSRQGAAYVFVKSGGFFPQSATQTAELTAADGVTNDGFGTVVATTGDKVVASAFKHQVGANQFQGAAYEYERPGFVWANGTETAELTDPAGVTNDVFGVALGVSGNVVAVGGGAAPRRRDAGLRRRRGVPVRASAGDRDRRPGRRRERGAGLGRCRCVYVQGAGRRDGHGLHGHGAQRRERRHRDGRATTRSRSPPPTATA